MVNGNSPWSLDVSAFQVLLGEGEELDLRFARRSLLDCFVAAPVGGLQSYVRTNDQLTVRTGMMYINAIDQMMAPMRNMRFDQMIQKRRLLRPSNYTTYRIPSDSNILNPGYFDLWGLTWLTFTWVCFGGLILLLYYTDSSWIGYGNCALLIIVSTVLRLSDYLTFRTPQPQITDEEGYLSIFILGQRNSCFILEGSRRDIAHCVACELESKIGDYEIVWYGIMRSLALATLLFVLITVPNGTLYDQIVFVALNCFGQLNTKVGQYFSARRCICSLNLVESRSVKTRTHVYANLLQRYGDGPWVDKTGILPGGGAWKLWRSRIEKEKTDPKILYESCCMELLTANSKIANEAAGTQETMDSQGAGTSTTISTSEV